MTTSVQPVPEAALGASAPSDHLDAADAGARFIRGSVWLTLGYGVNVLLSVAAVPLVIRHLGPVGYGRFATVTAVVFIVAGLTEAGLTSLGVREYSNRPRAEGTWFLRNLIGLRLAGTAVVLAGVVPAMALAGSPGVVVVGLLVAGAALMLRLMGDNFGIPLTVRLRMGWVALTGIASQAALCAAYVALVAVGAGVVPMLGAAILSGAVLLAATAVLVRDEVAAMPAFDLSVWRPMIRETLPFAAAAAVGIVYFREALVLMSFLTSERQTGYYAAAFRIVEVLTVVPWVLASSVLPILARAARDDLDRLRYATRRMMEGCLVLGGWMSASVFVAAKLGINVVAGPSFGPSVTVLQIQGLAIVTSFLAAVLGYALLSLRLYRPLLLSNALAVSVATVLALVLIPAYGAKGGAIAPTVAEACLGIAYATSLARSHAGVRLSLGVVPRLAVALAAGLALAYAIPVESDLLRLVALTGVFWPFLYLMKGIPAELIDALARRRT